MMIRLHIRVIVQAKLTYDTACYGDTVGGGGGSGAAPPSPGTCTGSRRTCGRAPCSRCRRYTPPPAQQEVSRKLHNIRIIIYQDMDIYYRASTTNWDVLQVERQCKTSYDRISSVKMRYIGFFSEYCSRKISLTNSIE